MMAYEPLLHYRSSQLKICLNLEVLLLTASPINVSDRSVFSPPSYYFFNQYCSKKLS